MKRYNIIQSLIDKNNYQRYLEIGVSGGDCFNKIKIPTKHSIDPAGNATFNMTSDNFFASYNGPPYSIIFIDGLHKRDQVLKDITNSLNNLSPDGTIVMHDCLPETERQQFDYELGGEPWTGDTWKAWAIHRMNNRQISMRVVDTDWGCGIIQFGQQKLFHLGNEELNYDFFCNNKRELMNIISIEEFKRLYL